MFDVSGHVSTWYLIRTARNTTNFLLTLPRLPKRAWIHLSHFLSHCSLLANLWTSSRSAGLWSACRFWRFLLFIFDAWSAFCNQYSNHSNKRSTIQSEHLSLANEKKNNASGNSDALPLMHDFTIDFSRLMSHPKANSKLRPNSTLESNLRRLLQIIIKESVWLSLHCHFLFQLFLHHLNHSSETTKKTRGRHVRDHGQDFLHSCRYHTKFTYSYISCQGPCLEFLLNQRILETLCMMGLSDVSYDICVFLC